VVAGFVGLEHDSCGSCVECSFGDGGVAVGDNLVHIKDGEERCAIFDGLLAGRCAREPHIELVVYFVM
jgi:hypothetical protein